MNIGTVTKMWKTFACEKQSQ